jgi:uncharacterized protein (DUF427 family)
MAKTIKVYRAQGTWVVRAGDAVVGESRNALELDESGHNPVIYFPRADLAMALMEPSATTSTCPWKGQASYWNIVTPGGTIRDAGWSYENPLEAVAQIAGCIAFHPEKVTVERV